MITIGKALGTAAIWGGAAVMTHLFSSADILTGSGAAGLIFVAAMLTFVVWLHDGD